MAKRIKILVDMLLENVVPVRSSECFYGGDDWENDGDIFKVSWHSEARIVTLEACEHRIYLSASVDDGGPCPPSVEVRYSPQRLKLWLEWLQKPQKGPLELFDDLLHVTYNDGSFNQMFDASPLETALGGVHSIDESVWRVVKRIFKERADKKLMSN